MSSTSFQPYNGVYTSKKEKNTEKKQESFKK